MGADLSSEGPDDAAGTASPPPGPWPDDAGAGADPDPRPSPAADAFHRRLGRMLLETTATDDPGARVALRDTLERDLAAAVGDGLVSRAEAQSIWSLWHYLCGGEGGDTAEERKRRVGAELDTFVHGRKRRRRA